MRMGSGAPASMISRTARSIRCSSSPDVAGAPADEDDLAAVAVGVGGQERDLLALDGTLHDGDQGIEPAGRHLRPLAADHLVGPVEVEEGHGDPTVLGLLVGA